MPSEPLSILLTADEIRAITGASSPTVQFNELKRLGFTRVRRGLDRGIILERAHYEAVCAGAVVLPPTNLPKAAEALLQQPPRRPAAMSANSASPAAAPTPPPALPASSKGRDTVPKVTLEEWARLRYDKPISKWVLLKWRREGQIYPPPERVWPYWMVEPDARRNVNGAGYVPLVERLKAQGI